MSPGYVPADPSPTQCRGQLHFLPASRSGHSEARSAGGSVLPGSCPARDSPAYPILILDDFNADGGQSCPLAVVCGSDSTALVCLELADCMGGSSEEQGRSPQHAHPRSQTPPHLGSGHHLAAHLLWPSLERLPCPDPNPCPPPSRTPALTFTGETVGGDPWKSFAAHVAEGGAGVRAGVPVVHAREVLHVELCGLKAQPCPISAWDSLPPSLLGPESPQPNSCPPCRAMPRATALVWQSKAHRGKHIPHGNTDPRSTLPTSPHGSPTSEQISGQ